MLAQRQGQLFWDLMMELSFGLIWAFVKAHLSKVGDSWQGFLIRNGFVSLPPEPVNSLPLCVDDSIVPFL